MTSRDTESESAVDRTRNQPGVLCPKCDNLNYLGHDDCERCGAHLYVDCPRCGQKNARVYTRCKRCHKRLRGRGLFGRHHHRHSALRKAGWPLLQVLLILLGLGVVGGLLYLVYVL